jgi:hypothetical protein
MRALRLTALQLCLACIVVGHADAQQAQRIATVGWLTGCLEMRSGTRVVEEQRMTERAGTMLGMGRTVNARGLGDYELTLIKEDAGRLLFEAHPKGQPPATFAARAATADSVVFEAPEHDFPQRVIYRRCGEDLCAAIEGTVQGKQVRQEWRYRRVH